MKVYSKSITETHLRFEVESLFRFECPNCSETFESEEGQSKQDFIKQVSEVVRYVDLKHMSGLLCSQCYNDKDVQNSSL